MKHIFHIMIFIAFSGLFSTALAEPPAHEDIDNNPLSGSKLNFHISPIVDYYFYVQSLTANSDSNINHGEFNNTVKAVRQINKDIGKGLLAWSLFSGNITGCESAADFLDVFSKLPEIFESRTGKRIALRQLFTQLGDTLLETEQFFLDELWQKRKVVLEARQQDLLNLFDENEQLVYHFIQDSLGMNKPQENIPVYLVTDMPTPGAVTYRLRSGKAACFVATHNVGTSLLLETVIHETIHSMDVSNAKETTVLNELRITLLNAGIKRTDPVYRNVPHMLIFVQAAETIRRKLYESHKDYGEVKGLYSRLQIASEIVRPIWVEYLDGRITQDEAIKLIAQMTVERE